MLSEETMRQSAPQQNEMLDPKNPFENPMENREYRMDYRRVLPQILLPGFQVPFAPEREERRAIRKCLNIAGLGILLSDLISQLLAFGLMFLVTWVLQMRYHMEWNTASDYLSNSSILIAINGLIFSPSTPPQRASAVRACEFRCAVCSRRRISRGKAP